MVIPAPAFDPAATLQAVASERCTSLYGVPTMFIAELALPDFADYDLSSLRTGIMAGSPCPVEVMKRVISEMQMAEVTIAYGMTETSPVSTQTRCRRRRWSGASRRWAGCIRTSRSRSSTRIPISPSPTGTPGELCTRGYSVMNGYWDEPDEDRRSIARRLDAHR